MGLPESFTKYTLISLCSIIFVFLVIDISNSGSMVKDPLYHLSNFKTTGIQNSHGTSAEDTALQEVDLCPATILSVKAMVKMAEYNSLCDIHRLTKLTQFKTLGRTDEITHSLSFLVKNPKSSVCSCPRKLKLADFPLMKSALLSFPGSGNTWTRHLIQQLTGIHTGSVYKFASIKNQGFPFEGVTINMSAVKTHKPPSEKGVLRLDYYDGSTATVRFNRLIILLRNPYASFVAEYKRGTLGLGKVATVFIDNSKQKWKNFVTVRSKTWRRFIKDSFGTSLPSLVIYYEDLVSCLLPELVKLASFLGNQDLREFSFCCTLKEHEGAFHRQASNQSVEDVFSDDDRIIMNGVILQAASFVKEAHPEVAKRIMGYMLP